MGLLSMSDEWSWYAREERWFQHAMLRSCFMLTRMEHTGYLSLEEIINVYYLGKTAAGLGCSRRGSWWKMTLRVGWRQQGSPILRSFTQLFVIIGRPR